MRTLINEREVVIQFNTDTDVASVYTSDYSYMTRLDKLVKNNPGEWSVIDVAYHDGDVVSKTYKCPKKLISFRGKTLSGRFREYTEEEKRAIGERLKNARKKGSLSNE